MNNISFQGKTTLFVSPERYNKALEKTGKTYREVAGDGRIVSGITYTTKTGNSKAGPSSLAVIICNQKGGVLKHVSVQENSSNAILELVKAADELKTRAKEKITAWIIGGSESKSIDGDRTIKKLNQIADELCDRPDIDTSILVGSKECEDEFLIHQIGGELEIGLNKNPKVLKDADLSSEEKMEKFFDIVELNNTTLVND